MHQTPKWLVVICSIWLFAGMAWAETAVFVLVQGGQIEGKLVNPDQEPRETYLIQLPFGGHISLGSSQVARVLTVSEDLQWYEDRAAQIEDTVEAHWELAEQCRERNLSAQREHHLRQVLRLEPEHRQARYGLGYSRMGDRWVQLDEWMRERGYVRHQGAWRTTQEVKLEQAREERESGQLGFRRQIRLWRNWVISRRGREREGWDQLRQIDDPNAAVGLIEILENEDDPRELRMLAVDVLGRLQAPEAVDAFIARALRDRDMNIVDACLDQLRRFGGDRARRAFESRLNSADNSQVRRAGYCLKVLGDPEATLPLINALVTEHRFKVETNGGGGGRTSAGFGTGPGGGGSSFGAGGGPKIVTRKLENTSVLRALATLWPGVNFGYNQPSWRAWYAQREAPPIVNLRRDD